MARSFYDAMVYSMTGHADDATQTAEGQALRNSGYGSQSRMPSFPAAQHALSGIGDTTFVDTFARVVQWTLVYAASGHPDNDSTPAMNACVEVRRQSTSILREDGTWEWLFVNTTPDGKRVYGSNDSSGVNGQTKASGNAAVKVQAYGNYGFELWSYPSSESPNSESFYGATNRGLCTQAKAIMSCVQVRRSLLDPNGTDDRSTAKFVIQVGQDHYTNPQLNRYRRTNGTLTDSYGEGYPYGVFDGGFSTWFEATDEWEWVVCVGAQDFWRTDSAIPPPWGNWSGNISWNKAPYSITQAALLANPPIEPPTLTGEPVPGPTPAPVPAPAPPPAPSVVDSKYRYKTAGETTYISGTANTIGADITSVVFTGTTYSFATVSGTYQLAWTVNVTGSPDTSVTFSVAGDAATVDASGLVTPVQTGSVVVTIASVLDPTKTDTFDIIVGTGDLAPPTINAIGDGPSPRTISGTANASALVSIYQDGTFLDTVPANAAGIWSLTISGLADATYSMTAIQYSGGLASAASSAVNMVVVAGEVAAPYNEIRSEWLTSTIITKWDRV